MKSFSNKPIEFKYPQPSSEFLVSAAKNSSPVKLEESTRISIQNYYFKHGIKGSLSNVYLRAFLRDKLLEAAANLESGYGFVIFDGYRSKETQAGLFHSYYNQIKGRYPDWSDEKHQAETRKFVAHPDEPSRFEVPPHNSGGAVDVGLTYRGNPVNMGTGFDDLTEKAETDYFECPFDSCHRISLQEWGNIREHRRILFHSLCSVGFTNWRFEWWHFDIGNCVWAQELGLPWVYDSMKIPADSQ